MWALDTASDLSMANWAAYAPSKIHRDPLFLPIPIAHRFRAVAATQLFGQLGGFGLPPAFLGFLEGALGGGGQVFGGRIWHGSSLVQLAPMI